MISFRALYRGALLPAVALLGIAAGLVAPLIGPPLDRHAIWMVVLVLTATPLLVRAAAGVLRGHFAADLVAALAMIAAILLQEPLPGLIVVLMQTGGEALERYAEGRASEAVRELEAAAPRWAHRLRDTLIEDIAATDVRPDDMVLVRPGELVPCDGIVTEGESHVDASTLTGEPLPVPAVPGVALMSGSVNGEGALTVRATRTSAESRYARIVELVRSAQESKSPIQRVADRYAVWFTPLTLLVCAVAYALSGDATRVLAVLVVATPCPLILATPVAIIGGINRAARRQIIVRDGGALERLATADTVAFDKTGTLTYGTPHVARVLTADGRDARTVLQRAASLEQSSGHLLGRAVVTHALAEGVALDTPGAVRERPGRGITGTVAGDDVAIGTRSLILELQPGLGAAIDELAATAAGMHAFVVINGEVVGVIEFADRLREGMPRLLADLRALGITRSVLVSGDHAANVEAIGAELGLVELHADVLPEEKVDVVQALLDAGHRVVMLGDGVNDAPALSTATVGIALAGHGGGITAEAADIVILVDEPGRLAEATIIAQRTLRIARQSIGVGLGLSGLGMVAAALGYLPPTAGALFQEGVDIAVIFNALRAAAPHAEAASRGATSRPQNAAPRPVTLPADA